MVLPLRSLDLFKADNGAQTVYIYFLGYLIR
jgi:hypothetical protein